MYIEGESDRFCLIYFMNENEERREKIKEEFHRN